MNLPVFKHTINALESALSSGKSSFADISEIFLSDPGLLMNLFIHVKERHQDRDFELIQPALALIGEQGLEYILHSSSVVLDEGHHHLWAYAMLVRMSAEALNWRAGIDIEDTVVTAAYLPIAGLMMMMREHPQMNRLIPLLLKLTTEDKIFVCEKIFGTNHIREMERLAKLPELYKDVVSMMGFVFSREGRRIEELDHPQRFSQRFRNYQLFKTLETAEMAAQSILYPQMVEAQERCREQTQRFFAVPDTDFEFMLASVISGFEDKCRAFGLETLPEETLNSAKVFRHGAFYFTTKYTEFNNSLLELQDANHKGRNICVWGEPEVGKRLLLASLHQAEDNPNRTKPFVSIYCSGISADNFESEFFGAKGGFFGFEKHRGAFELVREGGTLLIKNIDRMVIHLQQRLARVLSEGVFYRVGDIKTTSFRARIFLTSQAHPNDNNLISEDLLRVVNPFVLRIPPLRERRLDIELIAESIIEKYRLPIYDAVLILGLKEYYETHVFSHNLLDLKQILFYSAARHIIAEK